MKNIKLVKPVVLEDVVMPELSVVEQKILTDMLSNRVYVDNELRLYLPDDELPENILYGSEAAIAFLESIEKEVWSITEIRVDAYVALANDYDEVDDILFFCRAIDRQNSRLEKLIELGAPLAVLQNEYRLLHEKVERLYMNSFLPNPCTCEDSIRTCIFELMVDLIDDEDQC